MIRNLTETSFQINSEKKKTEKDRVLRYDSSASYSASSSWTYFGSCFAFGFAVVAPVVLCLFLVDIGMAFMSRTMPQMNVFVMSLSLKVIVGLIVLAISFPFAGSIIRKIFDSIFECWNQLLG